MRSAEWLDGLAVGGPARVGAIEFGLPALLYAGAGAPRRPRLVHEPVEHPGYRRLRLETDSGSLSLSWRVSTPEISGGLGTAEKAAERCWVLHHPIDEASWQRLLADRPELLVLGNARALLSRGEQFVLAVGEIRRRLGAAPLLWAPRVALPHRLAALTYLGVDLLDTTEGQWRAAGGERPDATLGSRSSRKGSEGPALPEEAVSEEYATEWTRVLQALRSQHLRELVEVRLGSEPALAELLRYADRELGDLLEERSPVATEALGNYVYREASRRPEVRRFRQRFLERYLPPPSKSILLLVPCSRTKPYRYSRSHRSFSRALEGLAGALRVHVVSVTSPLGLVPRELEDIPPARHYDIPVTGDWDEEERAAVVAALRHLLAKGNYQSVVAHLDPVEYGFLPRELPEAADRMHWTVADYRTTTPVAISSLRAALEAAGAGTPLPSGALSVVREELEALARFQFGPTGAELLFRPPVRLRGRPWFQRLCDPEGTDLASWQERRGLFQLTVAGGVRLQKSGTLQVEAEPDLELRGDLFTPAVRAADRGIRTGDAVLVIQGGRLSAVGEAALPGPLMTELPRGLAVRLRHRAHAAPATPTHPPDDIEMRQQYPESLGPVV
ncbi:MAG: DUF5591 domain-containing protein [Thermoplasmata archaeon]|nr:DUF5591 domain-containing protein [Thermoplasmata archaeon]